MDFMMGLPHTNRQHDSVWVIVDRITKSAHFLPIHTSYSTKNYGKLDIRELVRFHGVPLCIISDRASVHPVFHVSLLKKCIGDPTVVVPIQRIDVQNSLSYEEILVKILNYQTCRLRNKEVPLVKVLWQNQFVKGSTWEAEEDMRTKYPHFFSANPNLGQDQSPRTRNPRCLIPSQEFKFSSIDLQEITHPDGVYGFCDGGGSGSRRGTGGGWWWHWLVVFVVGKTCLPKVKKVKVDQRLTTPKKGYSTEGFRAEDASARFPMRIVHGLLKRRIKSDASFGGVISVGGRHTDAGTTHNDEHDEEEMIKYVRGERPNPDGKSWTEAKRILSVISMKAIHYHTIKILLEEGKINVYDYNEPLVDNVDLFFLMEPLMELLLILLRESKLINHFPKEASMKKSWDYDRQNNNMILLKNDVIYASGSHVLAHIECLLIDREMAKPMTILCDNAMVNLQEVWAYGVLTGCLETVCIEEPVK
ncbi:putative uroporphyrinogen decarboxylase, chloroplastic-like [Capsicum annuum]|nr:putative uroporphyrinogen decarboxylase, chloroplastic-like [Capsicum annuum]